MRKYTYTNSLERSRGSVQSSYVRKSAVDELGSDAQLFGHDTFDFNDGIFRIKDLTTHDEIVRAVLFGATRLSRCELDRL